MEQVLAENMKYLLNFSATENDDGAILKFTVLDREYSIQIDHKTCRDKELVKQSWMQVTSNFFEEFVAGVQYCEYLRANANTNPEASEQSQQQQQNNQGLLSSEGNPPENVEAALTYQPPLTQ